MNPHGPEHEQRLAALLAGEEDPRTPDAARWLAECATCRARWEALRGVSARVGAAGATQRERLDELARAGAEPGEDELARALAQLAVREPHAPRRPRWGLRARLFLAAAALLVAFGAWLGLRSLGGRPEPVWLDDGGLVLLAPRGEVEAFDVFEWSFGLDAERYELTLYDEADGRRGSSLHHVTCREKTWRPSAEIRAQLGRRIQWEVVALDFQGAVLDAKSASASLSSR